jgi:hypothetical protein
MLQNNRIDPHAIALIGSPFIVWRADDAPLIATSNLNIRLFSENCTLLDAIGIEIEGFRTHGETPSSPRPPPEIGHHDQVAHSLSLRFFSRL